MKPIVTLTLNPAIDGAAEAEVVRPTHKIRTTGDRYDPGGGGINVARVIAELGGPALPVYLAGGATGVVLDELLVERGLAFRRIPIAGHTRISLAVLERSTGLEYRFVPEGPEVTPGEWLECLGVVDGLDFDWLVISGSRPPGLPDDCFVDPGPPRRRAGRPRRPRQLRPGARRHPRRRRRRARQAEPRRDAGADRPRPRDRRRNRGGRPGAGRGRPGRDRRRDHGPRGRDPRQPRGDAAPPAAAGARGQRHRRRRQLRRRDDAGARRGPPGRSRRSSSAWPPAAPR